MAMTNEQVANQLKKLGDYQGALGATLHWLETQGTLKPMLMSEVKDLIKAIKEVLPQDVIDAVEEGVSNQLHATLDHSPHDPGDESI